LTSSGVISGSRRKGWASTIPRHLTCVTWVVEADIKGFFDHVDHIEGDVVDQVEFLVALCAFWENVQFQSCLAPAAFNL